MSQRLSARKDLNEKKRGKRERLFGVKSQDRFDEKNHKTT